MPRGLHARLCHAFLVMHRTCHIRSTELLAGVLVLVQVYERVIRWWFLCALERDCIAPTTDFHCRFDDGGRQQYGHCHRFDQSALNILLANYFSPHSTPSDSDHRLSPSSPVDAVYVVRSAAGRVLTKERNSYGREQVNVCHDRTVHRVQTSGYI